MLSWPPLLSGRQCPKLELLAFIKCGEEFTLVNYLQNRTRIVKWNGKISTERKLNGGDLHGANLKSGNT